MLRRLRNIFVIISRSFGSVYLADFERVEVLSVLDDFGH